ncbi:D-alanyl-D-alanine carboxypeptidase family protein [Microbacterium sp. SD291]|uniref:D-alanyl-D-alanine carboxypeptidase family protein n=1 Tax=Microbacterium sp. SD291 TaxID=2782007 RepID=UPI001A95B599|nr:D-alanyl-D-alanine carboxypeptidase [Microbacterium sp. SD291]MBO0981564.1 D-alanyl-D-alanine carboxypeptidase [Microbacterium sp. SD291]
MTAPDSAEAVADVPPDDAPAGATAVVEAPTGETAAQPTAQWADRVRPATALTWVDASEVAGHPPMATLDGDEDRESGAALLRGAKLRPAFSRPGVLVPLGILTGLVATYCGATLLWPLHEVAPTVRAVEFEAAPAPPAAVTWLAQGSAAVGVGGMGTVSSSLDPAAIASVTKVVSSLMVLDRMPLAVGEQGPEFSFTWSDNIDYWDYRRNDQSALDVPVGGVLTEYQLLQGTLLGSANNYIDRLADEIWGSDRAFAAAAETWLRDRGIEGITVVTPSGFHEDNVATPAALIELAENAMSNPVFASIVGTPSVELPGAGTVVNTNGMLADAGVVGVKTGTLEESWNLLTAKDVTIGDSTVRLYAAVLGQADDEQRLEATRSLFSQIEAELREQPPAVPKDTVIGTVETMWGTEVDIITASDADAVLWDSAAAESTAEFSLGDLRDEGDDVGTLTTSGPLGTVTTVLELADEVSDPSPWWRLTHPLELLGLADAQR